MFWTAFTLGLVGSFHCLGMCGPIALSLGGNAPRFLVWQVLTERLLYNLGRATTYAILGAVAGFAGQGLFLLGLQQPLMWLVGGMLIAAGLFAFNPDVLLTRFPGLNMLVQALQTQLSRFTATSGPLAFFSIGLLNGLVPCGLVYMGLAGALATGSVLNGVGYMFVFGLGTLPMMLAVAFSGSLAKTQLRAVLREAYPVALVALGAFIIYRAGTLAVLTTNSGTVPELICH